jgi:U6 snRNA-associated Sm-like protein LSm6
VPAPCFISFSQTAASKRSPSDFLKSVLGRPVRVKLNSGIEFRGVLACLDGYLNIAMEQTEEYGLDGQLKAKYGNCFIRGNNVLLYSSAQKRK